MDPVMDGRLAHVELLGDLVLGVTPSYRGDDRLATKCLTVFLLRMALSKTSGRPKSRAFIDFLFAQFPEQKSVIASPDDVGSRIITP